MTHTTIAIADKVVPRAIAPLGACRAAVAPAAGRSGVGGSTGEVVGTIVSSSSSLVDGDGVITVAVVSVGESVVALVVTAAVEANVGNGVGNGVGERVRLLVVSGVSTGVGGVVASVESITLMGAGVGGLGTEIKVGEGVSTMVAGVVAISSKSVVVVVVVDVVGLPEGILMD